MEDNADNIGESSDNQEDNYKSSKLLLEYISKEYDKEDDRSKNLDSRISIFITLSTVFLGYIFGESSNNLDLSNQNIKVYTVYIILYSLCVLAIFLSLCLFIWVMCIRKYRRVRTEVFDNATLNSQNEGNVSYELIKGYKEALENNIGINDLKTKRYMNGIILLVISMMLFMLQKIVIYLFI